MYPGEDEACVAEEIAVPETDVAQLLSGDGGGSDVRLATKRKPSQIIESLSLVEKPKTSGNFLYRDAVATYTDSHKFSAGLLPSSLQSLVVNPPVSSSFQYRSDTAVTSSDLQKSSPGLLPQSQVRKKVAARQHPLAKVGISSRLPAKVSHNFRTGKKRTGSLRLLGAVDQMGNWLSNGILALKLLRGTIERKFEPKILSIQDSQYQLSALRREGISIPSAIITVVEVRTGKSVDFERSCEIKESAVIVESGKVLAIILHDSMSKEICDHHAEILNFLFQVAGVVTRGKGKASGRTVMCGKRCSRNDGILSAYVHNRRRVKEPSAEEIEQIAGEFAEYMEEKLKEDYHSWMTALEEKQTGVPFDWTRLGRTCFTCMSITQNYEVDAHVDHGEFHSFIVWFHRGEGEIEGGQFVFPEIQIHFRPKPGTTLLFHGGNIAHYSNRVERPTSIEQIGVNLIVKKKTIMRGMAVKQLVENYLAKKLERSHFVVPLQEECLGERETAWMDDYLKQQTDDAREWCRLKHMKHMLKT